MNITDFEMPAEHPWGMLEGQEHASEKERLLAYMLTECIKAGDLAHSVRLKRRYNGMVRDSLLEEVDGDRYRLTKKSKGFLWAYYGKEAGDLPLCTCGMGDASMPELHADDCAVNARA